MSDRRPMTEHDALDATAVRVLAYPDLVALAAAGLRIARAFDRTRFSQAPPLWAAVEDSARLAERLGLLLAPHDDPEAGAP